MSIAAAFVYIAAMRNPAVTYDPHLFAIGLAGLFGAACGAIGLLISRGARAQEPSCARRSSAPKSSPTASGS